MSEFNRDLLSGDTQHSLNGSPASLIPSTSPTSPSPSNLLSLPRELRNLIYKSSFQCISDIERSIFITGYNDLSTYNGTLESIVRLTELPLLHTNKQIAAEALEILFKHTRIIFACGPGVLLVFLRRLPHHVLTHLRAIELGWTQLPSDLKHRLPEIMEGEVLPLFRCFRDETRIASLTVSLHFHSARRRRQDRPSSWRMPPQSWYNVVVATHALIWLFEGRLEEVVVRYEPLSAWSILDPKVDVGELVGLEPGLWELERYESLQAVQEELWDLGYIFDLRKLVVGRESQAWHRSNMDEGIGREVVLTMRVPAGMVIEQDEEWSI